MFSLCKGTFISPALAQGKCYHFIGRKPTKNNENEKLKRERKKAAAKIVSAIVSRFMEP